VAGHRTSAAEGVAAAAGATGYCTSATERTSAAAGTSPGPNGMAGGVVDAMEASVGEPLVVGFEASEAGAAVARACEQTGVAAADAPVDGDRNPEKPAFVSSEGPFPQKIARSCQALREACRARGGRFLRAVIMSHLKCGSCCSTASTAPFPCTARYQVRFLCIVSAFLPARVLRETL
jgi:hypothetical protein